MDGARLGHHVAGWRQTSSSPFYFDLGLSGPQHPIIGEGHDEPPSPTAFGMMILHKSLDYCFKCKLDFMLPVAGALPSQRTRDLAARVASGAPPPRIRRQG